jgi:hypothetical protein
VRTNEREGDEIDAAFHAELDILPVLLGDGRGAELRSRKIHPLVGFHQAAVPDHAGHICPLRRLHRQFDESIVDQDPVSGFTSEGSAL